MVWMREHFVEVRVCFGGFCMAGIRNAGPVLADLQRICKRLLVLAVQMLFLFLVICKRFARNGADSNGIQGTPHKGVSCF